MACTGPQYAEDSAKLGSLLEARDPHMLFFEIPFHSTLNSCWVF